MLTHSPSVITSGLVLYLDAANPRSYPGSGTTWFDLSGNGNNGILTNSPTFSNTNRGALFFNGSNQYATLGTPSLLNGVQVPLTISLWARLSDIPQFAALWAVDKSLSGGGLYSLLRVDSGVVRYFTSNSSGGWQYNQAFSVSANVWNFYTITVSGTISSPVVRIYLNDSFRSFNYAALTNSPDLTADFRIGYSERSNSPWSGDIASVTWYNRSLDYSEVVQNFNATRGRFGI